jgi:Fungal specific transcription factor domain
MDGGAQEKAMAYRVNRELRQNIKKARLVEKRAAREEQNKLETENVEGDIDSGNNPSDLEISQASPSEMTQNKLQKSSPFICNPSICHQDTTDLLVHYLNKVFPAQYSLYCAFVPSHNRGWLLSLILKSSLFRATCLSASAYHLWSASHFADNHYFILSNYYRTSATNELLGLVMSMNSNIPKTSDPAQILACVVQLLFLEVRADSRISSLNFIID